MPTTITHTLIIVAITCAVSMMAFSNNALKSRLIFWSPAINKGQVERFVDVCLKNQTPKHGIKHTQTERIP